MDNWPTDDHISNVAHNGECSEGEHLMNGRISPSYTAQQTVQAVYVDGAVRTCAGDVWNVTRSGDKLLAVA